MRQKDVSKLQKDQSIDSFNHEFQIVLEKSKDIETRLVKLEVFIPEYYRKNMGGFLTKFFGNNPFEVKPDDLEEVFVDGRVVKRVRYDRRPISFLSLFRFLELYRKNLDSIQNDINYLVLELKKEIWNTPEKDVVKTTAYKETIMAGRFYQKLHLLVITLYQKLVDHINESLVEAKENIGEDGYVNIRKLNGDAYLTSIFNPYYAQLINNLTYAIAVTQRIHLARVKIEIGEEKKS